MGGGRVCSLGLIWSPATPLKTQAKPHLADGTSSPSPAAGLLGRELPNDFLLLSSREGNCEEKVNFLPIRCGLTPGNFPVARKTRKIIVTCIGYFVPSAIKQILKREAMSSSMPQKRESG